MTAKTEIVRQLGEQALLLPGLLAAALAANDRIKLRLSLLQEAAAQARAPGRAPPSLDAERRAAGLADPRFDATIAGARALANERVAVPGAGALVAGLAADLAAMLAPLRAADAAAARPWEVRLATLAAAMPPAANDELALAEIEALAAARRPGPDSVHLLVMDVHRALNRLAAETAVETIDGARVHHVEPRDRARIAAFMAGLKRTAPLAFGHPGLGTTAARIGERLTIQNDIGTTDAHVLVVHVDDASVSVTYTDVHRRRARFFMALFDERGVDWGQLAEREATGLADEVFHLVVGRFAAADETALRDFLAFLGSRIVFLIDWNKARKALQTFVGKDAAVDILRAAAAGDHGHRAFLELGGADLVFEAIRRMAAGRIPYGARLDATLGPAECRAFLLRVLRQAAEGLRAGRSVRLVRDEIQADLAQLLDTAEFAVLTVVVRHLGLTRILAAAIAEVFADAAGDGDVARLATEAKRLEEKADRLTAQAREICERVPRGGSLRFAVDQVENATDALDEGAFLLSLAPRDDGVTHLVPLARLAEIVVDSIGHLVRAAEAASRLPQGLRSDAADSLQAIDAVLLAERHADAAEREAFGALMRVPSGDARALVLGLEIARALEGATDSLAHAALALRDRLLEELSA